MDTASPSRLQKALTTAALLAAMLIVATGARAQTCTGNPRAVVSPVNQSVPETTNGLPTIVQIDGSGSTPNRVPLHWTYRGSTPAGLAVTIADPAAEVLVFAVPAVGPAGATLEFELTATCGTRQSTATAIVNVTDIYTNSPPVAVVSTTPASVFEGDTVVLDGSASHDSDHSPPTSGLAYSWSQVGGEAVVLAPGPGAAVVSFVAPNSPASVDGTTLRFRLEVSDGTLGDSIEVLVTVLWANDPPVALLDCPWAVDEGDWVELDGSASYDTDDGIARYEWRQNLGPPNVDVVAFGTPAIGFQAPALGYQQTGELRFELEVADHTGDSTLAECTVLVNDVTPPVIDVPDDIVAEAVSALGAVVAFSATAQDAVEDAVPYAAICDPPSGSLFALGALPVLQTTTTVLCSAMDTLGNAADAGFTVTVRDTTAPTLALPDPITAEATGPDGAVVVFVATSDDAVDGPGAADCSPASGSTFALGTTQVGCGATDARGNAAPAQEFGVTVQDTTAPVIAPADDIQQEATGPDGAAVAYGPPATSDLVDGAGLATCLPASGSTFALGHTTVTCSASDGAGNAAEPVTFRITIVDTTPPQIDDHPDVGPVEATGPDGAAVAYDPPATTDLVDGAGTATCAPPPESTFALGVSTVTCEASDNAGNAAAATTFMVTVVDTTPPSIAEVANVGPIEATGPAGAVVAFAAPATLDLVDGAGTATCAPVSGSSFGLGVTAVTCTATDLAGNTAAPRTFTVTVVDTTAPVIAQPVDVGPVEATGPDGAEVTYEAPGTSDAVDGPGTAACTPASGGTFALGDTTVTCQATDNAGNAAVPRSFAVTVVDTTPPLIEAHDDVTATATGASSADVEYTLPGAVDLVDGPVAVECTPPSGSTFSVGQTTVACTARDSRGNVAESTFRVIVSYEWLGFFRPIDNPPVVNAVKAGSAVPVKFSLGGDQGLDIFAAGSPASGAMACTAAYTDTVDETVSAGASSLSYDAVAGQYVYVWKTDRGWGGSCRLLQVKLRDGIVRHAAFQFRK